MIRLTEKSFQPPSIASPEPLQPGHPPTPPADSIAGRPRYPNEGASISQIWNWYVQPDLDRLLKKSGGKTGKDRRSQYATAINRWLAYWAERAPAVQAGAQIPVTSDPPAERLWGRDFRAFMDWNVDRHAVTERTAEKQLNCLKSIWRDGFEGVLPFPRVSSREHKPKSEKVELTTDAVALLYSACESATWPILSVGAPAYWRAAICLWVHYGFRTQELIQYSSDKRALHWEDISLAASFPESGCPHRCKFGWLRYTPEKQSRKKPQPIVLPMTEAVRSHLDDIRPPTPTMPSGRIFPFPLCHRDMRDQWKRIVESAGLAKYAGVDQLKIKHLRTTCGEWHCAINEEMGSVVLGHAARTVTNKNYVRRVRSLLENFRKFPIPTCMQRTIQADQLRLF